VALVVLVAGLAVLAQHSRLERRLRSGDLVVVPAGEAWTGNLYAAARLVRVEGRVDGDLVAVGGDVDVSGEVTGDVMAIGGTVEISGRVDGDARLVGGRVLIHGSVGEDVTAAGGQLHVATSARVGDDLAFASAHSTMDGQVLGDVLGATVHYARSGMIAGTEGVTTGGEEAHLSLSERTLRAAVRLASILGVAAILLWLLPGVVTGSAAALRRRPLTSTAAGVFGLTGAVMVAMALLLVMVLVGMGLGLLGLERVVAGIVFAGIIVLVGSGFLLFLASAFAASAVTGLAIGRFALRSDTQERLPAALALGTLVVVVLSALPEVGCWLAVVAACAGVGGVLLDLARRRSARRAAAR